MATWLFQGGEVETLHSLNNASAGMLDSNNVDSAFTNNPGGAVMGGLNDWVQYDSLQPAASTISFSTTMEYGGGGGPTAGAGLGLQLCDASQVPWLRVTMPTTLGVYTLQLWNGSVFNTIATSSVQTTPQSVPLVFSIDVTNCGSATLGTCIVRINGTTIHSVTGQNFSGFAGLKYLRCGCMGTNAGRITWSNPQMSDTTLVLHRNKACQATSNGTDSTDGTGTFSNINEISAISNAGDTGFIELTTAGQHRSFKAAARTLNAVTSYAVTVTGRLMVVDATGPQKAKPYVLISGTRYYGTTFTLTTGFLNYQYTWLTNPSTSAAWTQTQVNDANLEFGWEAVT